MAGVWHITRAPLRAAAFDDPAFLVALVRRPQDHPSRPGLVFLAGLSNGGGFAELVVRHGLLPLAGLFVVAGTIREFGGGNGRGNLNSPNYQENAMYQVAGGRPPG